MNTHTYAVIEIDRSAFLEIIHRLAIAGHPTDCLHDDLIDMYGIALKACAPPAIVAETDGIEILSDGTVLGTVERVEEFRQFVASRGKLLDHPSVRKPAVDQIGFPVVEPSREIIDERNKRLNGEITVEWPINADQTINVGMDFGLTHDRIAEGLSVHVLPVTDDHEMACKCSRHSVTHWIEAGCPQPSIRAHYQ